jgi:hypothetical protein
MQAFPLLGGYFIYWKFKNNTLERSQQRIDLQRNGDACVPMFNYKKNKMLVR